MTEVLPVGVGRLPEWWMQCTPHYVLDLEEDEARRRLEEQMAVYYAQMAAADDAGFLGPDGQPKLGPDGKPLWTSSGWGGRGPGGEFRIDPTLFGISTSDPNYQSYLTGAKLPPGFLEKMQQMNGSDNGMANNLKQTDYGRYGRQAEKLAFQPSWMKKKLRSTGAGSNIRKGEYDDSPNKHYHRRVNHDTDAPPSTSQRSLGPEPVEQENQSGDSTEGATVVRKVRKVRRVKKTKSPEVAAPAPVPSTTPEPAPSARMSYARSDYYYNGKSQSAKKVEPVPEPQVEPEPEYYEEELHESYDQGAFDYARNQDNFEGFGNGSGVSYDEIEIVDDAEYEEEVIESTNGEEADLNDLQAILAAKQAELARLKAMM